MTSTPETRIAEALAEHDKGFIRFDGDWQCRCGAAVPRKPGLQHCLAAHQAAVIAALPDIAIVDRSVEWFILKGGFFADNGTVLSGPYSNSDDAYRARNAVERVLDLHEYYVDSRALAAGGGS